MVDLRLKCAYDWKVPLTDVTVIETYLDEENTKILFKVEGKGTELMGFPDSPFMSKTVH